MKDVTPGKEDSMIRLRLKDTPDTYIVVSNEETKKFCSKKTYHKVYAATKAELVEKSIWDTCTVFEIKQEGVEAAQLEEKEAYADKNTRELFKARIEEAIGTILGISGILMIGVNECPVVPNLRELMVAILAVFIIDPVASFIAVTFFAYSDLRKCI